MLTRCWVTLRSTQPTSFRAKVLSKKPGFTGRLSINIDRAGSDRFSPPKGVRAALRMQHRSFLTANVNC